ncbi:hypothetical protein CYMTET_7740 [Cymbomonas tetramitiformis]|uniref:Uncharacterized protein n=1 Tax=Cymbomonas tetramitiformis TaxID=36881 RepID=A0AAE0GUG0_9CHLO|nr:hypothetical protein CYMTET_7740 [Cymbomonas tetramitiformis]
MDRVTFAEHFIKRYPGPEQVKLGVEIEIPGTWFNNMSAAEKRKSFTAVAVEYDNLKSFAGGNPAKNKIQTIRFQSDLWSTSNAQESFAALRVSLIANLQGALFDIAPLVAFSAFPENRHTGAALARWFKAVFKISKLRNESVSLFTLDGASNNKKALTILGIPGQICANHQLQRAVLIGLGLTGRKAKSKNAAMRWYRMSRKSRKLQGDIKCALTGQEDGICLEEPAVVQQDGEAAENMVSEAETSLAAGVLAFESSGASAGGHMEESESDADVELEVDDEDIVEANETAGKEFSLAHRCIDSDDWLHNDILESVLTVPNDANERLQVSNRGLQLDRRTMLALRLNPSINTFPNGPIFQAKQGAYDILEVEYNRALRNRYNVMKQPSAPEVVVTKSSGADAWGAIEVREKKRSKNSLDSLMESLGEREEDHDEQATTMEATIGKEIELFAVLRRNAKENPAYRDSKGNFDLLIFWERNMHTLPVHAAVYRGEVGCAKGTSANIEQTFSAAGVFMADFHAHNISAPLFEAYMIIRGNWKYPFLRPSPEQVMVRYKKKYGTAEAVPETESEGEDQEEGEYM